MGRAPSAARTHFINLRERCNKSQFYYHCRHCVAAHEKDPSVILERVHGRSENFKKHLRICLHVPALLDLEAEYQQLNSEAGNQRHDRQAASQQRSIRYQPAPPLATPAPTKKARTQSVQSQIPRFFPIIYGPEKLAEFERFLLAFQVENGLPDSFVNRPSTRRLFNFLDPASVASLPLCRRLGRRVRVEDEYSVVVSARELPILRRVDRREEVRSVESRPPGRELDEARARVRVEVEDEDEYGGIVSPLERPIIGRVDRHAEPHPTDRQHDSARPLPNGSDHHHGFTD
ncbi:hypothetical protein BBJ28_00004408 [Nothophytophthora sp. Chile5]|nr:hypothetical protein BBJ28_00004408 [Nothophytophthora sp. Chile5]